MEGIAFPFRFARFHYGGGLVTRREIARRCRIGEARLRLYERAGLLPRFGSVPARLYEDRVKLILAGRRVMSMQRLRESLALAGC